MFLLHSEGGPKKKMTLDLGEVGMGQRNILRNASHIFDIRIRTLRD